MLSLQLMLLRLIALLLRQDHRLQRCRVQGIEVGQAGSWKHEQSMT